MLSRILTLALLLLLPAALHAEPLARGDEAFAARALEIEADRVDPTAVDTSLVAYREALVAEPERIDIRWRVLRSLHYRGDFARIAPEEKVAAFKEGAELAQESLDVLAEKLGGTALHELSPDEQPSRLAAAGISARDAAELYFWSAVAWGAWSREAGLLQSVRKGVANRAHDYAVVSARLDPTVERGGAHRLLARLHAALPKVPFVSGFVNRSQAIPEAEAAVAVQADDPGNRFLLALTLIELAPEREEEARKLLDQAIEAQPRPELLAEDLATQRLARKARAELDSVEAVATAN
ncbi:MAG: hypothetical protein QNK05_01145 [Myxococcota bacterium]|nr:hypothetical protein [Myxococcota bacterium]